jgi:hypothetical protein
MACPETEIELRSTAEVAAGSKLVWHNVDAYSEGQHRGIANRILQSCDVLFTSDADEVWFQDPLSLAIEQAFNDKDHNRFAVTGKIDLWRSFKYQMVDGFTPVRILTNGADGQATVHAPYLHFGYAQRLNVIEYKMHIHGHKGEIISLHGSVDNYLDKLRKWTPDNNVEDCYHPASRDIWRQAEPFNKWFMPAFMQIHPNFEKEIIE